MKHSRKWLCSALAALLLLASTAVFAGCSDPADDPAKDPHATDAAEDGTGDGDNRFEGVNYDGREFRIYTSTNIANAGMGNSNFLIEGDDESESGGDLVNSAVMERNVTVEEELGVKLVFIRCDAGQKEVAPDIQKYIHGGLDEFDLIINDIFGLGTLVVGGNFRNTLESDCVFDFDRPYWYRDLMEDFRFMNGYQFILAGDFFIDILRSAHLLLLNKDIYRDYYNRSADEVYDRVSNYEWTYDKMNEIITDKYVDKNLNGVVDRGDRFGFTNGECLIASGQRMGSPENPILRQMESDAAVLPYPMLFASDQKYVTPAHDTTDRKWNNLIEEFANNIAGS